jgi:hypothetical protein
LIRLTAAFWVAAYRKHLEMLDIPCFVVRRGDDTAGAVFVKLNTLDGTARVFHRTFDLASDTRTWAVLCEGPETACDDALRRQQGFDPDLWVLEVEDRQGRHLLDEPHLNG